MADVARLAGVAISTVSRALTNPGRVNEKTRARIQGAAMQLGYTPNALARGLRVGKSNSVIVVLPGPLYYGASQIIPQVLSGINAALVEGGYHLIIANLDRGEQSERHVLDLAFGGSVQGVLILSSAVPEVDGRSLSQAALPIVSLLHDLTALDIPSVVTNDREAVRGATAELIALGHRRFQYLAGPPGDYHDVERYAGVLEALHEAGLGEDAVLRSGGIDYRHGFRIGVEAAAEYHGLATKPTAIIATSDDMAISFMSRVHQAGYKIPTDLSIVSFDGSAICDYCWPPLSSILQPVEEMGRRAVSLLIERINAPQCEHSERIIVPSTLVRRDSLAPVAGSMALF